MRTLTSATMLAAVLLVTAGAATAGNGGNNGNRGNGGIAHDASVANSNGVRSLDRDRGLERAAERRNVRSLSGKRVTKAHSKK